jgi:hypothetical protein
MQEGSRSCPSILVTVELSMSHEVARATAFLITSLAALVSLRMAVKGLAATEWLPFHAAAAGTGFGDLPDRTRALILFFVRVSGLSFLVVFFVLLLAALQIGLREDLFLGPALDGIGGLYCLVLGLLNRALSQACSTRTPWRESLVVAGFLFLAAALLGLSG